MIAELVGLKPGVNESEKSAPEPFDSLKVCRRIFFSA